MVYGFTHQSGGFVAIESEEGSGTTVTIHLPKAQPKQTVTDAHETDAELRKRRGETELLVEDTVAVRDATIMLLERLGYTVLTAENGASALEVASRGERIAASLVWTRSSAIGRVLPDAREGRNSMWRKKGSPSRPNVSCGSRLCKNVRSDRIAP